MWFVMAQSLHTTGLMTDFDMHLLCVDKCQYAVVEREQMWVMNPMLTRVVQHLFVCAISLD